MNGVGDLSPYVIGLKALVDQLGLRFAWLSTLDLWRLHAWTLAEYIWFDTKEPITEGEQRRRVEEARKEMMPVDELAEVLAERFEGWAEKDLTPVENGERPAVSDRAWNREVAKNKKELSRLVDEGALRGRRRGGASQSTRDRSTTG